MTRLWIVLALLLAGPALAQPPPAVQAPDVVVTAKPAKPEAVHRFVDGISRPQEDQLPQYDAPICPLALGLPPAFDLTLSQRMLDDARTAGAPMAEGRCEPNVIVIVTRDGRALLRRLEHSPRVNLGSDEWHRLQAVIDAPGPVRDWQVVRMETANRTPLTDGADPAGATTFAPLAKPTSRVNNGSRLQQRSRPSIDISLLVIDADAVRGLTLTQIADYAAMRTLARTRAPHDGGVIAENSILSLFQPDQPAPRPAALSSADIAYLRALYATSNEVPEALQRSSMARLILDTLQGRPGSR